MPTKKTSAKEPEKKTEDPEITKEDIWAGVPEKKADEGKAIDYDKVLHKALSSEKTVEKPKAAKAKAAPKPPEIDIEKLAQLRAMPGRFQPIGRLLLMRVEGPYFNKAGWKIDVTTMLDEIEATFKIKYPALREYVTSL